MRTTRCRWASDGGRGDVRVRRDPKVTRGRLKRNFSREMAGVNTREVSTGDMHGRWQSGSAARVETGKKARDGHIRLFLSADWEGAELTPPPFRASGRKIPVSAHILDAMGLLQCTAVLMLCGAQTGPWHLNIVAHIKDWLFSITPITVTRRDVEGAGIVDYINLIWCSDTRLALYERTSRAYGIHAYPCGETEWDAHWYIYRRGIETPSYAHVGAARRDTTPRDPARQRRRRRCGCPRACARRAGLDQSATLVTQTHVADAVKLAIELSARLARDEAVEAAVDAPARSLSRKPSWFSARLSRWSNK